MFFPLIQLEPLNTIQVGLPIGVLKRTYIHMLKTLGKAASTQASKDGLQ